MGERRGRELAYRRLLEGLAACVDVFGIPKEDVA
jgi:hypothetical protein